MIEPQTSEGTLGAPPNATVEFRLPDVGEGLADGEILSWRVRPGDRIIRDQILVEVQTDKSVVEIPAPLDGVVVELGGKVGDVLPVGAVLAVIAADDSTKGPASWRVLASPATRKLALERGIDL